MVLPVYVYGMSVLRKRALEIDEDYENLDTLIADMFETMYVSEGVGLAAPQVGKSIRLFIVDASPMAEDDPSLEGFKRVFINPVILGEHGEKWNFSEGCLSIPLIREEVTRQTNVRIEYYDENWELHEEEFDGIKARIIQHEYDHLEGRLFVDRVSPLRRKLLNGRLKAISRGQVDIDYRIVYPKKA